MGATETISKVLNSQLLLAELILVPRRGASTLEIEEEQKLLDRPFSPQHQSLLSKWNGIALEVIRFFGCGPRTGEVGRLSDYQLNLDLSIPRGIAIASDAAGFVYFEAADGRVYSFDNDGGMIKLIAQDIDDFVDRLVFGQDAAEFAGNDWLEDLKSNGLLN
jgi:hypothetical protein